MGTSSNTEAPATPGSSPIEPMLAALVDIVFRDGRHELARAHGRRGTLRLMVEVELGDHGQPTSARHGLAFEQRRSMKDGLR